MNAYPKPKLGRYGQQGLQHWREFLPNLSAQLEREGRLLKELQSRERLTLNEIDRLVESGLSPEEAWQEVREKYLILPPESSSIDTVPRNDLAQLHQEILWVGSNALQELNDASSAPTKAASLAPPAQHFDRGSASEPVFAWARRPISTRAILTGMAIGALLTMLFPPYHFRPEPGVSIWCGHSLVFGGAPNTGQRVCTQFATVDFGTLSLYWAAILLLGGLVWLWRGRGRT